MVVRTTEKETKQLPVFLRKLAFSTLLSLLRDHLEKALDLHLNGMISGSIEHSTNFPTLPLKEKVLDALKLAAALCKGEGLLLTRFQWPR